jgi:putative nucleotidyltransferase with HDIG domain
MVKKPHFILFVDDDPLVLQGLKRSLEEYSDEWVMDFSSNPKNALEKLSEQEFDAIVTDMHMPVMDGIQLLDLVSKTSPGVMRFVLSGNVTDTQVMRSTGLVHQMIPKPSDMDTIFNIVERACRLREMLTNPQLLHLVTGIKNLPSVPLLYNRLLLELESPNVSTQSVGNIIAQDTAMTAKILQLVNSAFFGLSDNVSSPQRAVTILGLNTVKALVLGIHVFSEYQGRSNLPISIDSLWFHSMMVSTLAFNIARSLQLSTQVQESARVSGILHDIGKLVLLQIPDFCEKIRGKINHEITLESEYQILQTSHAEMGGYLLGMWGLPNPIVNAITFHHHPGAQISGTADLLTALHTANGLANMCRFKMDVNYGDFLDMAYLEKVDVSNRLDEWMIMARQLVDNSDEVPAAQ